MEKLVSSIQLLEYNHGIPQDDDEEAYALLCALLDSNNLFNRVANFRNKFVASTSPALPCESDLFFVVLLRYVSLCKPEDIEDEELDGLKSIWAEFNSHLQENDGVTPTFDFIIHNRVRYHLYLLVNRPFFTTTLRIKGANPYKKYLTERFLKKKLPKSIYLLKEIFQPEEAPEIEFPVPVSLDLVLKDPISNEDWRELLEALDDPKNMLSVLLSASSPFLTHAVNFLIQMLHVLLWMQRSSCTLAHDAKASYCDIRDAMRGDSVAQEKLKESEALVRARAADMVPSFTEVRRMVSAVRGGVTDPDIQPDDLEPARLRADRDQATQILYQFLRDHFEKVYLEVQRQANWAPAIEERLHEAARDSFIQNCAVGKFRWLLHNYYIDHDCPVDKVVFRYCHEASTPRRDIFFYMLSPQEEQDANPLMRFIKRNGPFTNAQLRHLDLLKSCFFPKLEELEVYPKSECRCLGPMSTGATNQLARALREPDNLLGTLVTANSPILTKHEKITMAVLHARLWLLKSDLPLYYGGKLTYRHLYEAYEGDSGAKLLIEKYKAGVLERAADPVPSPMELELMFRTLREHEKINPGDVIYHIREEDLRDADFLTTNLGEPYLVKKEEAESFRDSDSYATLVSDFWLEDKYLCDCINKEPRRTFLRMKPPHVIPYVIPVREHYSQYARNSFKISQSHLDHYNGQDMV